MAMGLPTEADIAREIGEGVDPDAIHTARKAMRGALGRTYAGALAALHALPLPIRLIADQNVREVLVDDDGTFNYATAADKADLYALQDLPATPSSIFGVQWNAQLRKADASTYVLARAVKHAGTVYYGVNNISPGSVYQNFSDVMNINPGTMVAWTPSDVNALQAGCKLVSVA